MTQQARCYGVTATEQSDSLDKLFEAKSKALGEMRNAPKTCVADFGRYADLATVIDTYREPFSKNGLDITQTFVPWGESGTLAIVTTLGHSSGQFIRSTLPVPGGMKPQALGAYVTYMRRIAIGAIVGLAAEEEDDGRSAETAHTISQIDNEVRVEQMCERELRSRKTADERRQYLDNVRSLWREGRITEEAGVRLRKLCEELDAKQKDAAPVATDKPKDAAPRKASREAVAAG